MYQMYIDNAKQYGEENLKQDILQVLDELLYSRDVFVGHELYSQYVALITKITFLPQTAALAAFGMELMYRIMIVSMNADDERKIWLENLAHATLAYYRFYEPENP